MTESDEWERAEEDERTQCHIDGLTAENARLRAALQPFADFDPGPHLADDYPYYSSPQDGIKVGHFRAAKAALEET